MGDDNPTVGKIEQLTHEPGPDFSKKISDYIESLGHKDKGLKNFSKFEEIDPYEDRRRAWARVQELHTRVQELEAAIKEHAANFPDEPLGGEVKLWKTVGIEVSTFHGRFQNPNRQ